MVNLGQILIKIGTLPEVDGWQCADDRVMVYRDAFIELMMAPGIPCYSSMKSINEKWRMIGMTYGLVANSFPALDSEGKPKPDAPARAYLMSKERARAIIRDTIPRRIRGNHLSTEHYLKTGEVWY